MRRIITFAGLASTLICLGTVALAQDTGLPPDEERERSDPDFDADRTAFYYVRVIEIPTPRWTAYDAKYYGVDLDEDDSGIHQERAYTSPIWHTP